MGNAINLSVIVDTGLLGPVLGVAVIIITGIPLIIADHVMGGGDGPAGVSSLFSSRRCGSKPSDARQINPAFELRLPHPLRRWLPPA
ncbi:2-keto-3-deoxygluconate permease [Shigella flexneri]